MTGHYSKASGQSRHPGNKVAVKWSNWKQLICCHIQYCMHACVLCLCMTTVRVNDVSHGWCQVAKLALLFLYDKKNIYCIFMWPVRTQRSQNVLFEPGSICLQVRQSWIGYLSLERRKHKKPWVVLTTSDRPNLGKLAGSKKRQQGTMPC